LNGKTDFETAFGPFVWIFWIFLTSQCLKKGDDGANEHVRRGYSQLNANHWLHDDAKRYRQGYFNFVKWSQFFTLIASSKCSLPRSFNVTLIRCRVITYIDNFYFIYWTFGYLVNMFTQIQNICGNKNNMSNMLSKPKLNTI